LESGVLGSYQDIRTDDTANELLSDQAKRSESHADGIEWSGLCEDKGPSAVDRLG